jgi:hypothetical protein
MTEARDVSGLAPGAQVYLEDGQLALFCARASGGYVVEPIYGEDGEEPHCGDPITVRAVFDKPPAPRYDAETRRALEELEKARAALNDVRSSIQAHNTEAARIKANLRKHNMLAEIEAVLENRITHAVTFSSWEGDVQCVTLAEALKDHASQWRLRPLHLEATLGGERASLRWVADDRSATDLRVFTNEEDAKAYAVELVQRHADGLRTKIAKHGVSGGLEGAIRSHKRLGLEVPADLAEVARAGEEQRWREALKKAEAEAVVYRERLSQCAPSKARGETV